jgi:hypothetical protein
MFKRPWLLHGGRSEGKTAEGIGTSLIGICTVRVCLHAFQQLVGGPTQ